MKRYLTLPLWAQVACLSLLPLALCAGTLDPAANLFACRHGWTTCDLSRLTPTELKDMGAAETARNISNCRRGLGTAIQRG